MFYTPFKIFINNKKREKVLFTGRVDPLFEEHIVMYCQAITRSKIAITTIFILMFVLEFSTCLKFNIQILLKKF